MLSPSQQEVIEHTKEALRLQSKMLKEDVYIDPRAAEYLDMAVAALEEQLRTQSVPSLRHLSAGAK